MSARRQLEALSDAMHDEVVQTLIVALRERMTPAVIQRLRDIYDDALRQAFLVGQRHYQASLEPHPMDAVNRSIVTTRRLAPVEVQTSEPLPAGVADDDARTTVSPTRKTDPSASPRGRSRPKSAR